MFLVYYISVSTIGGFVTDWTNDGLFGDGFHPLGIGTSDYDDAMTEYAIENVWTEDVVATVDAAVKADVIGADDIQDAIAEEDFGAFDEAYGSYGESLAEAGFDISETVDTALEAEDAPATEDFGVWWNGIPVLVQAGLDKINCAEWLSSLLVDGIVGGVGAVLGFVPQYIILYIKLAADEKKSIL